MIVDARVLRGTPYRQAVCMGMPHVHAHYNGPEARDCVRDRDAECAVCRRPATNVHHEPPLGMGGGNGTFTLTTPRGTWELRPALIALCGSGTDGCHGKRHDGLLRFEWLWTDRSHEEKWWEGEFLSQGFEPHDPRLLDYGGWWAVWAGDAEPGDQVLPEPMECELILGSAV